MKGKFSTFEIVMVVLFVLVAAGGGFGYYTTSGQLEAVQEEAGNARQQLNQVVQRGYLPTAKNVQVLEANNALEREALAQVEARLKPEANLLAGVAPKNPVLFKQDLAEKVKVVTESARRQSVGLPPNFYLGFSRFKAENPDEKATIVLGKQLLATEQLCNILFTAGVAKIDGLQRSFEEDGSRGGPAGSASAPAGGEELAARVIARPHYTVYPLQVDFTGTTISLRRVLGDLLQSPYLFVVRSVAVTSTRPVPPKMDELEKAEAGKTGAAPGPRAPRIVLGDEQIRVRLRLDVVEWGKNEGAKGGRPEAGARRQGGGRRNQNQ